MQLNRYHAEWLSLAGLFVIVSVVFWQIETSLTEQGIAEGDAFHNAAFYPRAVAILLLIASALRVFSLLIEMRSQSSNVEVISIKNLRKPAALVLVFVLYLALLGPVGFDLLTVPFFAVVMLAAGERSLTPIIGFSVAATLLVAYIFENYLLVVLPIGLWSAPMPW